MTTAPLYLAGNTYPTSQLTTAIAPASTPRSLKPKSVAQGSTARVRVRPVIRSSPRIPCSIWSTERRRWTSSPSPRRRPGGRARAAGLIMWSTRAGWICANWRHRLKINLLIGRCLPTGDSQVLVLSGLEGSMQDGSKTCHDRELCKILAFLKDIVEEITRRRSPVESVRRNSNKTD